MTRSSRPRQTRLVGSVGRRHWRELGSAGDGRGVLLLVLVERLDGGVLELERGRGRVGLLVRPWGVSLDVVRLGRGGRVQEGGVEGREG